MKTLLNTLKHSAIMGMTLVALIMAARTARTQIITPKSELKTQPTSTKTASLTAQAPPASPVVLKNSIRLLVDRHQESGFELRLGERKGRRTYTLHNVYKHTRNREAILTEKLYLDLESRLGKILETAKSTHRISNFCGGSIVIEKTSKKGTVPFRVCLDGPNGKIDDDFATLTGELYELVHGVGTSPKIQFVEF